MDRTIHEPTKSAKRGTPTDEQYRAFQVLFDHLNAGLFGSELPPVLLTLAALRNKRAMAYFKADSWKRRIDNGELLHEISVCPAHTHDAKELAANVVHEMVHLAQHVAGTAGRRGYHNRDFADRCHAVGLEIPVLGQSVWQEINPEGPFERVYAELPEGAMLPLITTEPFIEDPPIPQDGMGDATGKDDDEEEQPEREEEEPADPSKVKYACPTCGFNAWHRLRREEERTLGCPHDGAYVPMVRADAPRKGERDGGEGSLSRTRKEAPDPRHQDRLKTHRHGDDEAERVLISAVG